MNNPRKLLFRSVGIIFFVLVVVYSYGRFGRYIKGPHITEINLVDYQVVDDPHLTVFGQVANVQEMKLNGRALAFDKDFHFSEQVVLSPGLTTIEIELTDAFEAQEYYHYKVYTRASDTALPRSYAEALRSNETKEDSTDDDIPTSPLDSNELLTEPINQ